ncbi:MAG: hypothetical protein LBB89_05355 [Treponema sp.]|jgi:hypothetical protein|nr:hypothetical protein [Treponema sp.]
MKNRFKLIGIITLIAVIGFSCGDGGGGDESDPLNGTWNSEGEDKIVLSNGAFTTLEDNVECFKGTYSVSGSNISMTITQFTGAFIIRETDLQEMGLSPTQWYTQQAFRTAIINYYLTILGATQSQAEAAYNEYVAPIMPELYATVIGTVSGNTLNIFDDTFTKSGGSKPGTGGTGAGNWTAVANSTFGNSTIMDIAYNGSNRFVAVGHSGKMATSPDGVTWTAVPNSTFGTTNIFAIAYNGSNKFVAGGLQGKMAYSSDGVSWTAVTSTTFTIGINAIAWGNGKFVAVGNGGKMATSPDGETWTAVTTTTFGTTGIEAIAWGNGKFVATGYEGGKMATSPDGTTWTAVADSTFTSNVEAIAYGGNKFVAGGGGGKMAYSSNGETWTAVGNSTFTSAIYAIAWGNDKFVAGDGDGNIATSPDGVTWTAAGDTVLGGDTFNGNYGINTIAYGGNKFVVGGGMGKMAYSTGF